MKNKYILILIIVFIIAIALLLAPWNSKQNKYENYDFSIYAFNAGKADAMILSKNNKYIMIDTGEQTLSSEIIKYLKKENINRLEYLIITHFDKDHVGSSSHIINNVEIGKVLQSNVPKESEYYNNYMNALNANNIISITVSGDYKIKLDDLEIIINGPEIIYDSNKSNNSSLIVSVFYGNNKFLFMGDAQNKRIEDFVGSNDINYDFMKIPYHGKYMKKLDDLFNNTNIKYGIMTCSNSEGCEDKTISLLKKYNVKYYMTKNGDILILSDGHNIKIIQ